MRSLRKLPLPASLTAELRWHLRCFPSRSQFVFTGRDGGPLRKAWTRRHFRPAAAKAAVLDRPPRLRPHHLRHTAASLLIAQGAHAKDVQEWLGHSSFAVTMNVYAHLLPERQHALADGLEDVRRAAGARDPAAHMLHEQ